MQCSTALFSYQTTRFITRTKGGLIGLVYQETLKARTVDLGETTAIALMGTDIERIGQNLQSVHEIWASIIEIGVAIWLLQQQVFLACLAPVAVIASSFNLYHDANVKFYQESAECPQNISPMATFAVYVVIALLWKNASLLTAQAFTAIALINLLTTPVLQLVQLMPKLLQCVGSFERIQEYCNYADDAAKHNEPSDHSNRAGSFISLHPLTQVVPAQGDNDQKHAIILDNNDFTWEESKTPLLKNINLKVPVGSVTVCAGAVGSGKSMLLKSILGETICSLGAAPIRTSSVAYCAQQPWLENGTIQSSIIGVSPFDSKWYKTVKSACGLDADLQVLDRRDKTVVGSNGLNLSGGQKQRIALARAVYSRKDIVILDDVFSGMDAHTVDLVSRRLLESDGLFRKRGTTVILATHSHKLMSLADTIVALEGGRIAEVGSPQELLSYGGYPANSNLTPRNEGPSREHAEETEICRVESTVAESIVSVPHTIDDATNGANDALDTRRKNGDWSVYSYYFSSSGYMMLFMFLVSMTVWVFCTEFATGFSALAKASNLIVFSQYLAAMTPFVVALLYFLQSFYLQTSRQVRLLEIEAKAPLYTHFIESVAGAPTIRAFGWQSQYQERNHRFIDRAQRPAYLQHCIQHWLGFVLDLLVTAIAVVLVAIVVTWKDKFSAGNVGVSLVMVMTFSSVLMRLIKIWTMMESSVGAVARVKRFVADTESEDKSDGWKAEVARDWPTQGNIEFRNLVAAHSPSGQPVIKGISLSIRPSEHVALCGRSGSGKTSAILALLQIIETQGGQIMVDGVDVSTISCTEVRSQLNVVPQDPFLMPGTIRSNIDPFEKVSDEDIIQALERVRLWTTVSAQGGLSSEMDTAAWSAGQKQLLCLARAMVRNSKVLILDEATSSVDSETEAIMQGIVDTTFQDCTVLAVMHRLTHITRYDKVALLDDGHLVEFDAPETLLSQKSRFAELYQTSATRP
ncbi:hypothetical protein SLS62_004760 [Diatrype stigma]|uniref:Uncharacterized protein n=1 Tax=Diatrype stigma TaxID=117547 RepID=A0AAN9UTR2_9PEZI